MPVTDYCANCYRFSQAELKSMDSLRKLKLSSSYEGGVTAHTEISWRHCAVDMATGIVAYDDEELLGEEDYVKE
jgi:hypothetical protein